MRFKVLRNIPQLYADITVYTGDVAQQTKPNIMMSSCTYDDKKKIQRSQLEMVNVEAPNVIGHNQHEGPLNCEDP